MRRAPSNTYAVSVAAIGALLILAALAVLVAFLAPHGLRAVTGLFEVLGGAIAAAGGIGAGSLAARDVGSGGLTSSSGDRVLAARRAADVAPSGPPEK